MRVVILILLFSTFLRGETASLVDQLLVLDEQGNQKVIGGPASKLNSIGVMFVQLGEGQYGVCTVTHLNGGRVLTARHCLTRTSNLADYTILFYTAQGQRQSAPIEKVLLSGSDSLDIALLQIPSQAASAWPSAGKKMREIASGFTWFSKPQFPETVKVWSFTPLHSHPFKERFPNHIGMVFTPNRCHLSDKAPYIQMKKWNAHQKTHETIQELTFAKEKEDTKNVTFLDKCERPFIEGNSGALITLEGDFNSKLGVLSFYASDIEQISAALEKTKRAQSDVEFYYVSGSLPIEKINGDFKHLVIGIGTLMESLSRQFPEIWNAI